MRAGPARPGPAPPRPAQTWLPFPAHTLLSLDRSFEAEINYNNPLGTGGRLAIGFAVLLRALWKGTHHAFQPSKLKVICSHGLPS